MTTRPDPRKLLRIKVYRVDPATGTRRTVREETVLPGDCKPDPYSLGAPFPPCQCPFHRTRGTR